MKTRKIISATLCATLVFGMTGCDFLKDSTQKQKKEFIDVLEDLDFVEYERKKDLKTGVYASITDADDIEDFFDLFTFPTPDEDDVARLSYGFREEEDGDYLNQLAVTLTQFKDEDDAEDFYEDLLDFYVGLAEQGEGSIYTDVGYSDEDDEEYYLAINIDENGEIAQVRITLHRDDECVYFILCLAYNDNAEDYVDLADSISKKLGFDKPSSYL